MNQVALDVFRGSFKGRPQPNEVAVKDFSRLNQTDYEGLEYTQRIQTWLNFLDVVATGLDADVYDQKAIKACFGPLFHAATTLFISRSSPTYHPEFRVFEAVEKWDSRFRGLKP